MKKLIYLFIVGFVISTISCNESSDDFLQFSEESETSVMLKNGMLVFSNENAMSKALSGELELPFALSFISKKDLFNRISDTEYEYATSLKDLSDEEYEKCQKHSSLYLESLEKGLIKEEVYEDNSVLYDLDILYPNYAKILNQEGFFGIGNNVYQVTSDELRVWKDCNNLSENNYKVIDTKNSQTKSLFPLKSIDQAVGYYTTDTRVPNDRAIAIFYDKTTLAIPNVKRNIYIRVAYQRKANGRDYTYFATPYTLTASFLLLVNEEEKTVNFEANGTGSNDWYTPYFDYEFMSNTKDSQIYTDNYHYIQRFIIKSLHRPLEVGPIRVKFRGEREGKMSGPFYYDNFDFNDTKPLSPLLPEN